MKRISTLLLLAVSLTVFAQDKPPGLNDFSLEDLMQVEVTTVSKKPQKLANVAAAVYVISAEDIRMSGANSLPEVLRMAPGVDATRISGNRWAVSIRGFATRLSNKLLVLVDGRNAYSPAFSGVLWDDFQFPMEDIERIEVIRGPAAAVWGSNGVNGVINIITKSAAATQGGQFVIGGGNVEGTYGRVRWGGQNADGSVLYRVYGSKQNANSQNAIYGGDGMDAYHTEAAGFRVDGYLSGGARWDVSGDFHSVRSDLVTTFSLPNTVFANPGTESHDGQTLRGRYIQSLSHGGDLQIQVAYAHANLTMGELLADRRETFDIDVHHLFKLGERHDIVWGGGYRLSRDNMPVTLMVWENETSRRTGSYGIFGQDEITLAENWRLTLGLRMDHNEFTGWEKQPDARLSWHLSPAHTLWGALSKTSRAPSRGEQGINFSYMEGTTTLGPGPTVPNVLRVLNQGQYSEKLKATQVGLRSQWAPALTTDAVLFSHRYDRVGAFDPGAVRFVPHQVGTYIDYVDIYLPYVNLGELTLNGAELSMDWHPAQSWYLRMSQTWQSVVSSSELMWVEGSGIVPHQTTSLHASWAPTSATNVSLWLRHMDERPGSIGILVDARRAYNSVDLSATWKLQKYLEISLVGQNLNDGACDAYADIPDAKTFPMLLPTCTPRSLSAQLRMNF